jgi:3-dehydroquinate dehydratase-2
MTKPIYILNGPNLNRLGTREPVIYGRTTLGEVERMCLEAAHGHPIVFHQSNREYELIDWVHEAIDEGSAIIVNPAALTFTSMALMDALKMFPGPIIELHISNIHRREPIYHKSYVSPIATAVIAGLGTNGYPLAVKAMLDIIAGMAAPPTDD